MGLIFLLLSKLALASQWDGVDPALLKQAKIHAAKRVVQAAPISTEGFSPRGGGSSYLQKEVFRATWYGNEAALADYLDRLEGSHEAVHLVVTRNLWRTYERGVNEYLATHRTASPPPVAPTVAAPAPAVSGTKKTAVPPAPPLTKIIPKKPVDSAGARSQLE